MGVLADVVWQQFRDLSPAETAAVVLAIAYLLLMIRQNIWCWSCAFVSSALYVWLFIDAKLYMESLLYFFYVAMAVYGYLSWRGGQTDNPLPVIRWRWSTHATALVAIVLLSAATGTILERTTDAAFPYVDSATTFAALWTTFLVARKVLENWWYWLVIDLASAVLYWQRDLALTALLFLVYVAMIPFGLRAWTQSYRQTVAVPA